MGIYELAATFPWGISGEVRPAVFVRRLGGVGRKVD